MRVWNHSQTMDQHVDQPPLVSGAADLAVCSKVERRLVDRLMAYTERLARVDLPSEEKERRKAALTKPPGRSPK